MKGFGSKQSRVEGGEAASIVNVWGLLPSVCRGVDFSFLCFSHFEDHSHYRVGMEIWTCIIVGETQFCLLPFHL